VSCRKQPGQWVPVTLEHHDSSCVAGVPATHPEPEHEWESLACWCRPVIIMDTVRSVAGQSDE
jgi:hypothetical protein